MSASGKPFLDYEKALSCIHCGLCLSSCPTYLETGNENDSPRGRIYLMRAVQDARLPVAGTAMRHIDLCLGCRACEAVCPSGVPYGDLLEHTRDHIEKNSSRPPFQQFLRRILIERIFPFPGRTKVALAPARITKWTGLEKILPRFAREALSLIPGDMNEASLPEVSPATTKKARGRVGFVRGCVMNVMFGPDEPEQHRAAQRRRLRRRHATSTRMLWRAPRPQRQHGPGPGLRPRQHSRLRRS